MIDERDLAMMYLGRRCTDLLGSDQQKMFGADQQKMFGEGSVVRALLSQHVCIIVKVRPACCVKVPFI